MASLIDVAAGRELVLESVRPLGGEEVPLENALGRVLAERLETSGPLPPFDSAAMDGYAVVAGPAAELPVTGESRAGHPLNRALAPGEAIAISTGAEVPAGPRVTVVPVERVEEVEGTSVRVPHTGEGEHVRRAGEDLEAGETAVAAGAVLGPAELAVSASLGRPALRCAARPTVAVLVTGDELVEPGNPLGPGQIRDSNATALAAQASTAGALVVQRALVPDDLAATTTALRRALDAADVVCISGGVSVGPHDHVKPALLELGVEERFWGVRLKPGKPTWFGVRDGTLVFGLPGNPVSAMVTFHLFARPALRALAGADPSETRARARLDAPVERHPGRDQALRCRLHADDRGWRAEPTKEQGSHVLSSMVGAAALALVPAGRGVAETGEPVDLELLPSW
jgi:molybdopterin molybdotransferase